MRDSGCDISDVKRAAYRDGSAYGARKARADQATVSQWRPEPSSLSATCVPLCPHSMRSLGAKWLKR